MKDSIEDLKERIVLLENKVGLLSDCVLELSKIANKTSDNMKNLTTLMETWIGISQG